jgi:UDP-3-O-[3-hydroxymyristoyl] glucosamine N-acyltransferase
MHGESAVAVPEVTFTVREVAEWVQGEVVGNGDLPIRNARPLSDAPQFEDITVVVGEKYLSQLHNSKAAAAVVDHSVPVNGKTLVRVKDPLMAFVTIVRRLHVKPTTSPAGIHPTAIVHPTAVLGDGVVIGPYVTVGEQTVIGHRVQLQKNVAIGNHCTIGDDCSFFPNVVIYDGCVVGNRVAIHANSVIGADGFGYRMLQGKHAKIPQVGHVEIGDDVEIGANSSIDRATFGVTRIGFGTKIDNHVQIGHNVQIGKHNIICAQVGIAGSVVSGDYVVMAGQVGIADHLTIGDRAVLGAQSGVTSNVEKDARMFGTPSTPAIEYMRGMVSLGRISEIRKEIKEIKAHLGTDGR